VRSAPDSATGAFVSAGVSRAGIPSSPTLWQFALAPPDAASGGGASPCFWRSVAGYELDWDSTQPGQYGSAHPMPAPEAALVSGSISTSIWNTSWDDATPGSDGALQCLLASRAGGGGCSVPWNATSTAACYPATGTCSGGAEAGASPATSALTYLGRGGGSPNYFVGTVYELMVLKGLPSASEATALREFYTAKVHRRGLTERRGLVS
jgi:hypothetical protein